MCLRSPSFVLLCTFLGLSVSDAVAEQRPRVAPPPLTGKLTQVKGLPVLELWGSPEQRGFAHGYLRAAELVKLFDEFIFSPEVVPSLEAYDQRLRPAAQQQFEWPAEFEAELAGLVNGANRRLSELKLQSVKLTRPFDIVDLKVANALADWFGTACSTVTLWGPLTHDGRTLTARNLDYFNTPLLRVSQQVVLYRGNENRRNWMGVGWPGSIGVYTALSDAGVTMLMHDSNGLPSQEDRRFVPRSIALRMALEKADTETAFDDVASVFRNARTLIGNNIHVSRPGDDQQARAAVFEYDGNGKDRGVTQRTAKDLPSGALWNTNHMRTRRAPAGCNRYTALTSAIETLRGNDEKLDAKQMFDLIKVARVERTLHTVCFDPQALTAWVYIPEIASQPIRLRMKDYLSRPSASTATQ